MEETVLLTGGSGEIGSLLLERLLARGTRVLASVHTTPLASRPGVEIFSCDLTRRDLGLSAGGRRDLAAQTTAILHCAGRTDFAASREAARNANVRPVDHLLAFAATAPSLRRVAILSTVYVAGKRRGTVAAQELTHGAGFVNEYERSKYEAEQLVRAAMPRLPLSVYRLSTVLCTRSGAFGTMGAVHHALRLFHAGLLPLVPGEPESEVDLITSDYAADGVDALFARFEAGSTHHVAAGEQNRIPLQRFLAMTAAAFASADARWEERGVELPPISALETFERLAETVETSGDRILGEVMRMMQSFAPQLAFPKRFDDAVTRSILRRSGVEEDRFEPVYRDFIRYAIETRWGNRKRRLRP
jgi:long-chain acyl-CoA synthetase